MPEENVQGKTKAPAAKRVSLRARALDWTQRLWRPAGTVIAVVLALLVTWHVSMAITACRFGSRNAPKTAPCSRRSRICSRKMRRCASTSSICNSDPDAIEREAREKLHYAKPGEMIVNLPDTPQAQPTK